MQILIPGLGRDQYSAFPTNSQVSLCCWSVDHMSSKSLIFSLPPLPLNTSYHFEDIKSSSDFLLYLGWNLDLLLWPEKSCPVDQHVYLPFHIRCTLALSLYTPATMDFFFNVYFYFFIWPKWVSVVACRICSCSMRALSCCMWDLVPWLGIEPRPPALGVWSLSHWTTRGISVTLDFDCTYRGPQSSSVCACHFLSMEPPFSCVRLPLPNSLGLSWNVPFLEIPNQKVISMVLRHVYLFTVVLLPCSTHSINIWVTKYKYHKLYQTSLG